MNIVRYLFEVSYDGSNYYGFQRQTNFKSIQAELERALRYMVKNDLTIHSAGRTDRGVHAIAQTFHVDVSFEIVNMTTWINGLNKRLPSDIIVNDVRKVDTNFHARKSAKYRIYKYVISKVELNIFNQRFKTYVENFDINLAKEASKKFVGVKDFSGFSKLTKGKDTVKKIISIDITETTEDIIITFKGISFLRYMVRSIVGTIIDVSTNKIDISIIDKVFETKNRKYAGTTAPAKGLYLEKIIY